jgi:hypothetical protein
MAIKTETRIIDGSQYLLAQMDAKRAFKLIPRIGHVIGPVLGKAGTLKGGNLSDVDVSVLGDIVGLLFERLTPEELEFITGEMLYSLRRDGRDASATGARFGQEMAGEVVTVFKLLRWAFELNYGDFFAVAPALLKAVPAR